MIPMPDDLGFFRHKVGQVLGLHSQPWGGYNPLSDKDEKQEKHLYIKTEWAAKISFRHTVYLHVIQTENKYIFALMLPVIPEERIQNKKWYAQAPLYLAEVDHWEHAIQDKLEAFNLLATDDVITISGLNWDCFLTITTGHIVSSAYFHGKIEDKRLTEFFRTLIHAVKDVTGYFEGQEIQKYSKFLDEQVMPAIKVL